MNNMNIGVILIHSEVYLDSLKIGKISYDSRQNKYIMKHTSEIYDRGFKFYYANSENGIIEKLRKKLNRL